MVRADTIIVDTDTMKNNLRSKVLTMEMPYIKGKAVYIENTNRKIFIGQSNDNKVHLTATAYYNGDLVISDARLQEMANIHMQKTDSGIVIRSGRITSSNGNRNGYSNYPPALAPTPPPPPLPPSAITTTEYQNLTTISNRNIKGRIIIDGVTPTGGNSAYQMGANTYNRRRSAYYSDGFPKLKT